MYNKHFAGSDKNIPSSSSIWWHTFSPFRKLESGLELIYITVYFYDFLICLKNMCIYDQSNCQKTIIRILINNYIKIYYDPYVFIKKQKQKIIHYVWIQNRPTIHKQRLKFYTISNKSIQIFFLNFILREPNPKWNQFGM